MKLLSTLLLTAALLMPAAIHAHEKELVGRFTALDRSAPGCGILFVGSMASFVTEDGKNRISLVVPCIEMQTVKTQSGQVKLLELHRLYRILVSPVRPKNLGFPPPSPDLLYLIEASEMLSLRPNNSFKLTLHRGGLTQALGGNGEI